jgi:hypothetical protein
MLTTSVAADSIRADFASCASAARWFAERSSSVNRPSSSLVFSISWANVAPLALLGLLLPFWFLLGCLLPRFPPGYWLGRPPGVLMAGIASLVIPEVGS